MLAMKVMVPVPIAFPMVLVVTPPGPNLYHCRRYHAAPVRVIFPLPVDLMTLPRYIEIPLLFAPAVFAEADAGDRNIGIDRSIHLRRSIEKYAKVICRRIRPRPPCR